MYTSERLVRFDWAIKRLLRNKADYCIVEGLLTALLGKKIIIKSLLESEGNQENETDKFNRVDLLAEDEQGELFIFEIQNNRELDYFHRMAYGSSKCLVEYMQKGRAYQNIRKVYSINIVYFSLGQGKDYAYRGTTRFLGLHDESDELVLTQAQRNAFHCDTPAEIFPEYYLLRVDKFDKIATTPLDEWISFLKTGDIPTTATAPGLQEARERLQINLLDEADQKAYDRTMENLSYQQSVIQTGIYEGRMEGLEVGREEGREEGLAVGRAEGLEKGLEKGRAEASLSIARNLKSMGLDTDAIVQATGLTAKDIEKL